MNADLFLKEIELAVWELAEAETAERKARRLRASAAKRLSAFHAEFKAAMKSALATKLKPQMKRSNIHL